MARIVPVDHVIETETADGALDNPTHGFDDETLGAPTHGFDDETLGAIAASDDIDHRAPA